MIEGMLINLRAREEADASAFHRWFNDHEVTRFIGDSFPIVSMSRQRELIQSMGSDSQRRLYSIVLKDGTLIGNCELRGFNWTARSAEAGIVIGEKEYWGKGYGGEAMNLMLRVAFEGLNMHRVYLRVADFNERGIRSYHRIGFREEGRWREARFLDGRYADTVQMSILEHEWRERQTAEQLPSRS